jgi:hypothetical protein
MGAFRFSVAKLRAWRHRRRHLTEEDVVDRVEVDRLNAEYTGSFARPFGQEAGILAPRHDRRGNGF